MNIHVDKIHKLVQIKCKICEFYKTYIFTCYFFIQPFKWGTRLIYYFIEMYEESWFA